MKKYGFTLAEVLITLGIIGIIAVLTLPKIISKYNETITINKLRKTYSELQQAIKMSEVYNGSFRDWDYTMESSVFAEKYLMTYLSKNYKKYKYMKYSYYTLNGNKTTPVTRASYIYSDKNLLLLTNPSNSNKYVMIIIDLNGDRRKNQMGKDVFMFTLFNYTYYTGGWVLTPLCPKGEHYGLYLGGIGGYWGAYCATLEGVLGQDSARGDCKPEGQGTSCGLAIEKNGWKIPDKYPIKF